MNIRFFLSIAGIFVIPFLIVLIPIFIGQSYGIYLSRKSEDLQKASVGSVVGAAFGLLAFMLAFTFQMTAERYNSRKELLLDEVTNIRTLYLQAGLIHEPIRSDTKKLLIEYIDLRVDAFRDTTKLRYALSRSQEILDRLWTFTETLADQDRNSEIYALFITSVNKLVDNFNHRITMTFEYRIPAMILSILFIVAFLSMLVIGYQFGISGKGGIGINMLLAFIFAIVMMLILALDRPELGLSRLNQKPLFTLQKQLYAK
jgi:ABC-type multidrug transport system fused ATPase/permease subunit